MHFNKRISQILAGILISTALLLGFWPVQQNVLAQQPTGSIPTVTGTPSGVIGTVKTGMEDSINVRSGPSFFFDKIGILLPAQSVPVRGRSPGGDWLQIEYPGVEGGLGWVLGNYLDLTPGELPVVEPPPTPMPKTTATIDPTLAAQFVITAVPTRLPTYTPPAPLVIPTFTDNSSGEFLRGVPIGLVIISLAAIGIFIGLISLLQGR